MALSGVRSSWLMLARNSLLARLAPSARTFSASYFCASSAASSRLRSRSDHGALQLFLVEPARLLLLLEGGDVGAGDHQAAVAGAPLGDLDPAAVGELDLAALLAGRRGLLLADRQPHDPLDRLARGAGLQQARVQGEEARGSSGCRAPAGPAGPTARRPRDALDRALQPHLGGLGADLGDAFLGDVERHADETA